MEKLGIDWLLLITQIVNFLVMFTALKLLLYQPLLSVLEQRRKKIEEGLKLQEEMKSYQENMKKRQQQIIDEGNEEAKHIIEKAIKEANKKKKEIADDAQKEIEKEKRRMLAEIQSEYEKGLALIRKKGINYAVAISKKILRREISAYEQQKIIDQDIKNIDQLME